MRVLVVIPAHDWGGAERMAALVARALRENGQDVIIGTAHPDALGSELHGFDVARLAVDPRKKLTALAAVLRIRQIAPDVVYTMHRWPALLARWARWAGQPPVVYHAQSLVEPRRLAWWGDVTIAVSDAVRTHLLAQGADDSRIEVIHNAPVLDEPPTAAVDEARREIHRHVGDRVVAIFAGRLVAGKGVDVLLPGLRDIERLGLVVLGSGDEAERLHRLARDLDVNDRVWFAGWRDDVQAYCRAADIGVVPSDTYPEGLPLSALELMAAGLPVVVTSLSGLPEAVTDEVDGLVVPPGDAAALAAALERLADDPTLRSDLGQRAVKTVAERFDPEVLAAAVAAAVIAQGQRVTGRAGPRRG